MLSDEIRDLEIILYFLRYEIAQVFLNSILFSDKIMKIILFAFRIISDTKISN